MAKADSGATSHYIRIADSVCLKNKTSYNGPAVLLPDAGSILPTHKGQLSLSKKLSKRAQTATALPELRSASLISLGQLCDDKCTIILDKKKMYAIKDKEIILQGDRNLTDGLWDIPIHKYDIDENNYKKPDQHGLSYLQTESCKYKLNMCNLATKSCKYKLNMCNTKKNLCIYNTTTNKQKKENEPFFRVFSGLNKLIDVNECDFLCNQQLKEDTRQYRKVQLQPKINVILRKDKTKSDLAQFHHGSLFSPVMSTMVQAIKNNHLTTWPGLSAKLITKNLPPVLATAKGHLNQERQNIQSTKPAKSYEEQLRVIKHNINRIKKNMPKGQSFQDALKADILDDAFPESDEDNKKTNDIIYHLYDSSEGVGYTDLTGRFPYRSSRGNEYIMVAYNYDANAILAEPVKNRQALTLTTAWRIIDNKFKTAGVQPRTYVMDNECSNDLKQALQKEKLDLQLVPPHIHRANKAERAIQTFKNHLKAGLATLNPDFPVREWDRLIPQAVLTLNLLRSARINPKLSAWAYLFGQYDWMKTPLAPPGTKVLVHMKPNNRNTWAQNGEEGWTIGYSPEHYRCIQVYFPKTRSERNVDTVTFPPTVIPFPQVNL